MTLFICLLFCVSVVMVTMRPTLPDPSTVDVDLDGEGGVVRLVVVEDEDITAQSVDAGRVHRSILGKRRAEEVAE